MRKKQDGLPELLPPSSGVVFKRLFGDERNKDILADLLTEILGLKITRRAIAEALAFFCRSLNNGFRF